MTQRPIASGTLPPAVPQMPSSLALREPLRSDLAAEWMLDPSVAFLNHGCFGARPRCVAAEQQRWREHIDARPIELLDRRRRDLLAEAKHAVGQFLGASPENFGFVTNATDGVNAVLRSLSFSTGDELLTVNHVYNAVRMTMRHLAGRAGATAIEAELPFPIDSPRTVIEVIERHITERTKLLIIDEITSPTALRMPVGEVIDLCATRGIDVLVDGAHAPGMVEMNLESANSHQPAYYAGNLHKWGCAPIGTAFLWVRSDKHAGIHPTTISHFLDQGLAEEFQWQGTRDISGWLATPAALAYMSELGWDNVREHNHRMAVWVMHLLCERWGVEPTSPMDGTMLGSMVTLPVPQRVRERFENAEQLQTKLYDEHRIEIPIIDWNGAWWVRASCQVYNTADQYDRLASSMIACGA